MFKQYALGLLSIAALGTIALPVGAQQVNTQETDQSAAVIGDHNRVDQNSEQFSIQQRDGLIQNRDGAYRPGRQDNLQNSRQSAGVVGNGNRVEQDARQFNSQRERAPQQNRRDRNHHDDRNNYNDRNNHDDRSSNSPNEYDF